MNPTWTTRQGEAVPIRDMKDSHLLNTVRLLRRKYASWCYRIGFAADAYSCDAPDGAAMCAETASSEAYCEAEMQEHIEREIPAMKPLLAELKRRKLEELPI